MYRQLYDQLHQVLLYFDIMCAMLSTVFADYGMVGNIIILIIPWLRVQVPVHYLGREDCVCNRFQLPRHVGNRTPSSEGFIPFQENEVCYDRSLPWLKVIPTQQDITTFYCSLSILASINW